jgi:hypothetical protein
MKFGNNLFRQGNKCGLFLHGLKSITVLLFSGSSDDRFVIRFANSQNNVGKPKSISVDRSADQSHVACHGFVVGEHRPFMGQDAIEIPTLVFSIDENSEAWTEVGALAELYPELNHFRFSNRSRSTLFHVHPDTGVISIRDGAKLDFEKRSTITLTIVADIREEQNDPYLAEFAESLRDEGFSSRTLSRLIPLVQRIQVQVLVRDVQDAEEVPVSGNVSALEVPAVVDGSAVNPSIDASMTESSSTASVRQEPVTLDIQKPATDLSSTDLSVPGAADCDS